MKHLRWIVVVLLVGLVSVDGTEAFWFGQFQLNRTNDVLHGQLLDFTHNHGKDRRIWSASLCEKRDLYVYLPPCYDPMKRYPLLIYLHGANQDEEFFRNGVKLFDKSIADGKFPPVILAVPDGSLKQRPSWYYSASFWANTKVGRFEDWVMCDVWNFMMENFPIRPEREAHVLVGASMGGCGAFALAIKHKDRVKTAVAFAPALNLRWVDCHGNYQAPFDPNCWGWREEAHPFEVIGRPAFHIPMRYHVLFGPITGCGPGAMAELSRINPIEIMVQYDLRPGDLDLYLCYGGKDQFNIGAQVESFMFLAKQRGICVDVDFDPNGKHDTATGRRLLPLALSWLAPRVAPYCPAN